MAQKWYSRGSVSCALALAAAIFWWIGQGATPRRDGASARLDEAYSPPPVNSPKLSRVAEINNHAASLNLATDLEGTAVCYSEHLEGLIASDKSFRTDLPLEQMAAVLKVDPKTISKKDAAEIDPEAILFTVVAGRLSERAKAQSRMCREKQKLAGQVPSATSHEWVPAVITLTLSDVKHPNREQKKLLEAISQSAIGMDKQPGAGINAVPLQLRQAEMLAENVAFAPGFLPLEARRANASDRR